VTSPNLENAFQALAMRAWTSNRARAATLADLVAQCPQAGLLTGEQREQARAIAHSLRGSAGTFGHDAAASAAGELQDLLAGGGPASVDVVAALVSRIEAHLTEPPQLDD